MTHEVLTNQGCPVLNIADIRQALEEVEDQCAPSFFRIVASAHCTNFRLYLLVSESPPISNVPYEKLLDQQKEIRERAARLTLERRKILNRELEKIFAPIMDKVSHLHSALSCCNHLWKLRYRSRCIFQPMGKMECIQQVDIF